MTLEKIISGGQTGVDRGALSAALEHKFPCGGWCPEGRIAEDGIIPEKYPVEELGSSDYLERTIKNIQDSDGTVIIYFDYLEGGTEQTLFHCLDQKKPYKLIDASQIAIAQSANLIKKFIEDYQLKILNVAGPRASKSPLAYDYTYRSLCLLIKSYPYQRKGNSKQYYFQNLLSSEF